MAGTSTGRVAGGLALALACAVGVLALHAAFVLTATGQLVDDATLVGGRIGQRYVEGFAEAVLDLVSVLGLVVAAGAVLLIGVVRRRLRRALLAVAVVLGPSATTQVLKRWLLERPDLADTAGAAANSLPSGHTTFAAGVAAAVLVVLPPRARPAGAAVGAVYTAATGSATLAVGWHRASDVVAAVLVVGVWTGLVAALIALRDRVTPLAEAAPPAAGPRAGSGWRLVVPALTAAAVVLGLLAAVAALVLAQAPLPAEGRPLLLVGYAGGVAAVAASASAVFVATLVVLRPAVRVPAPAPGRPRGAGAPAPRSGERPGALRQVGHGQPR
jgi:hypothetical protein